MGGMAGPVVGGAFMESLDLAAATATDQGHGPSSGMVSGPERGLLTALASRTWRGVGAIVDGGSFLGASLLAEARGLAANPITADLDTSRFPAGRVIHGYEQGHHPLPTNPAAPRRRRYGTSHYVLGESFVDVLEENIAEYGDQIELHLGDLTTMSWGGSPVEIAFIDVCKTPELNAHVTREFYPALVPGASTLVHQDFFFDMLPWIRVTMGYLAEYFSWEGQVGSSSVYRNIKAIPEEVAARDPFLDDTLEDCLAYHDAVAFPGIDRATSLRLDLSRVQLILRKGHPSQALADLRETAVTYADLAGTMSTEQSFVPMPGTPEASEPRYRLDRTITQVCAGLSVDRPGEGGVAPSAGVHRTPEIDRAREALITRDFAGARSILEPLRADHPHGPAAFLLARTEFESGRTGNAAALLDEILAGRPRHTRARALRARVHLKSGDRESARAEAELSLQQHPNLVSALKVIFDIEVAEELDTRN